MSKGLIILEEQEWYQRMLEEIENAWTTGRGIINITALQIQYLIGNEILQNRKNIEKLGYGEGIMKKIAEDTGKSVPYLYQAVYVAKWVNSVGGWEEATRKLPPNANTYNIRNYIEAKDIPEPKEECQHQWQEYKICKLCGKREKI